jgi:hypothetical protein
LGEKINGMRTILVIFIVVGLTCIGCNSQTPPKDFKIETFLQYSTDKKVTYFKSLDKQGQMQLCGKYFSNHCFEYTIDPNYGAIIYWGKENIQINWETEDKNETVMAFKKYPELQNLIPYKWIIKDKLIIQKGKDYEVISKKIGGGEKLLFNLDKIDSIEFDKIGLFSDPQKSIIVSLYDGSDKDFSFTDNRRFNCCIYKY